MILFSKVAWVATTVSGPVTSPTNMWCHPWNNGSTIWPFPHHALVTAPRNILTTSLTVAWQIWGPANFSQAMDCKLINIRLAEAAMIGLA